MKCVADISALPFGDVRQNFNFGAAAGIPLSPMTPLSLGFPRVQMQVFIRALADNSLLRVLAEPNLVAISGETASFLVGGEFPIPVPQGVDQVTIEFREFGARLNFTPVVRAGQRIRLHIAPEVSELDFASAVTIAGRPTAAMSRSPRAATCGKSTVREWQIVTVQCSRRSRTAIGLPTMLLRPRTTAC